MFRGELCFLEERDGHLAGDDAEVGGIRDLKELVEHPFLLGREVEIGLSPCSCIELSAVSFRPYRFGLLKLPTQRFSSLHQR